MAYTYFKDGHVECDACGMRWESEAAVEDNSGFCPKCGTWGGSNPEDA